MFQFILIQFNNFSYRSRFLFHKRVTQKVLFFVTQIIKNTTTEK